MSHNGAPIAYSYLSTCVLHKIVVLQCNKDILYKSCMAQASRRMDHGQHVRYKTYGACMVLVQ